MLGSTDTLGKFIKKPIKTSNKCCKLEGEKKYYSYIVCLVFSITK